MIFYRALFFIFFFNTASFAAVQHSTVFNFDHNVSILVDKKAATTIKIAAQILSNDIAEITGFKPKISHDINELSGRVIAVGNVNDSLIVTIAKNAQIDTQSVNNLYEAYKRTVIIKPTPDIEQLLFIYGSDRRGSAYGIMDLVREMGISPWQWWADVVPKSRKKITVAGNSYQSKEPSVKYRGVFLNDEDWGLQPWAAKTFEPETGDIGPKTYAKIFELLLRLKANMIWPAMHPSTKAFYHYRDNPKVAEDYGIVIGTSHAEPMLRNNVDEWSKVLDGKFDYSANREHVKNYWQERVEQSQFYESAYTMGIRGIHDSPMEGGEGIEAQVSLMDKIIQDQRLMLDNQVSKHPKIQVLIPYKEVLNIYDAGLKVPEDITLVWPDDNHGYIRRLSDKQEQKRLGGSGVYYHLSYWGSPHDYLWLSSTHPALIREEMVKAYKYQARDIWIANVGDIKPLEYNMTLFLDMAFDIEPFLTPKSEQKHLEKWLNEAFDDVHAAEISPLLLEYYRLAYSRRPEFMAWNRIEPKTLVERTDFNHFDFNDEAERRLKDYQRLAKASLKVYQKIPREERSAYYQLVHYPIVAADALNRKFINLDKAYLYAKQGRSSANDYAVKAKVAHQTIIDETVFYNEQLSQGKWRHMMSMTPRGLKVFDEPNIPRWPNTNKNNWGISVEGITNIVGSLEPEDEHRKLTLPHFSFKSNNKYFFDLFITADKKLDWFLEPSHNWIHLSQSHGELVDKSGRKEQRIWVSIDWDEYQKQEIPELSGIITIKGGEHSFTIELAIERARLSAKQDYISSNGIISIFAENFVNNNSTETSGWETLPGLGRSGAVIRSFADANLSDDLSKKTISAKVDYPVYFSKTGKVKIIVHALPTHPVTSENGLKVGLKVNDKLIKVLDFSAEPKNKKWDKHVLNNNAIESANYTVTKIGHHNLQIEAIDPEVIIDRIEIETAPVNKRYSLLPETSNK